MKSINIGEFHGLFPNLMKGMWFLIHSATEFKCMLVATHRVKMIKHNFDEYRLDKYRLNTDIRNKKSCWGKKYKVLLRYFLQNKVSFL